MEYVFTSLEYHPFMDQQNSQLARHIVRQVLGDNALELIELTIIRRLHRDSERLMVLVSLIVALDFSFI
jgi:hypothetical protein